MKKQISIALLSALMLSILASCGDSGTQTPTTQPTQNPETTASAVTDDTAPVDNREPLNLPDANFNGAELRILEYDVDNHAQVQYSDFYSTPEMAGDLINDAVSTRNMMIEERYNCKINVTFENDTMEKAKASITAGTNDYDVCEIHIDQIMSQASNGYFHNFYEVPHIALDKSWWDQEIQRDLAMFDKIYAMTGDISMQDEELNYCVFYNKALAAANDVEDLYAVARDGKWTLDKMQQIAKDFSRDVDGNGVRDENDAYGVVTDGGMIWLYFMTCGGTYAQLDNNGVPYLTAGEERNIRVADAVSAFLKDSDIVMWASRCSNAWVTLDKIFMEDRVLFKPASIYDITIYRNMISDFGVLPYPKYDEAQDSYYHPIATQVCPGLCIPATNTGDDLDRTGFLLEALAYESRNTVTKAYYDVNLYNKMTRDNDSGDMLDIIFSTKRYDLGKVFGWGGIESALQALPTGNQTFATLWAKKEKSAQKAMEKTIEFFSENE